MTLALHMQDNIASSRVWVHGDGKFTILGECVVNLEMGQCSRSRLTIV